MSSRSMSAAERTSKLEKLQLAIRDLEQINDDLLRKVKESHYSCRKIRLESKILGARLQNTTWNLSESSEDEDTPAPPLQPYETALKGVARSASAAAAVTAPKKRRRKNDATADATAAAALARVVSAPQLGVDTTTAPRTPTTPLATPTASTTGRRTKPKADPNAPKRPANAFFTFCQLKRESVKRLLGRTDFSVKDSTRLLGQLWRDLRDEERQIYWKIYVLSRERHKVDLASYLAGTLAHTPEALSESVMAEQNAKERELLIQLAAEGPVSQTVMVGQAALVDIAAQQGVTIEITPSSAFTNILIAERAPALQNHALTPSEEAAQVRENRKLVPPATVPHPEGIPDATAAGTYAATTPTATAPSLSAASTPATPTGAAHPAGTALTTPTPAAGAAADDSASQAAADADMAAGATA